MDDLVEERPVETDRARGGGAAHRSRVDLGRGGRNGALLRNGDVGGLRGLRDLQARLDGVEARRGLKRLPQAEASEDVPQLEGALVVPVRQVNLRRLRGSRGQCRGGIGPPF